MRSKDEINKNCDALVRRVASGVNPAFIGTYLTVLLIEALVDIRDALQEIADKTKDPGAK
jgi:hypothetical protein